MYKGLLSYYLIPHYQAFIFQITNQDTKVTKFLKNAGNVFSASNGWQVRTEVEPEVNYAKKIVYLRGSDSSKDSKIDRTWNMDDSQVNTVISEVNVALQELIKAVKDSGKVSSKNISYSKTPLFDRFRVIVYEPTQDWINSLLRPSNLVILD